MLISHKDKKIFLSIPKTGSTSIMSTLNEKSLHYKPHIYHATYKEIISFKNSYTFNKDLLFKGFKFFFIQNILINKISNYNVYAVVREPIERLISVYFDAKADKNHKTLNEISSLNSLDDFFNFYLSKDVLKHPRHLWPQSYFIEDVPLKNLKLYDFNNLQGCLDSLQGNFFWQHSQLPHLRKTNSAKAVLNINDKFLKALKDSLFDDYKLYNSLRVNNL